MIHGNSCIFLTVVVNYMFSIDNMRYWTNFVLHFSFTPSLVYNCEIYFNWKLLEIQLMNLLMLLFVEFLFFYKFALRFKGYMI